MTKNGYLNFTSERGITSAIYKNNPIDAYLVNHEKVSEYEYTDRCSYFFKDDNYKFIVFSSGSEYVDFVITGFSSDGETTYNYSYYDTSMKIVDNKLTMHLSLNFKIIRNKEEISNKTADVTLSWNRK